MKKSLRSAKIIALTAAYVLAFLMSLFTGGGGIFSVETSASTPEQFIFEVTVTAGATFRIPLNGLLNNSNNKEYDWNINWGDGNSGRYYGTQNNAGIPHTYTDAGTYPITITPTDSSQSAWLGAFGFSNNQIDAGSSTNRNMITKVISPLTPQMTRTPEQIAGSAAPPMNEWAQTFSSCRYLTMGDDFTFSGEWNIITSVSHSFAANMFGNCSSNQFTMNAVFNLPQGITTVGNSFAAWMFSSCNGTTFKMNDVFTMPQGIMTVGSGFAERMFRGCNGAAFTMGAKFNLPENITTVGDRFAVGMFEECFGVLFNMNDVFNLPEGITTVGHNFAENMFSGCFRDAFTMNDVFNLPEGITTVGNDFAVGMFLGCDGAAFNMNDVFNLPEGITTVGHNFANSMFGICNGAVFNMNDVFNMPQGITTVGNGFATAMFHGCGGAAFNMNGVFNLPQGITTVGNYFAVNMFSECSGVSFMVNDVFRFPTVNGIDAFHETFRNLGATPVQTRTAASIIGGNPIPSTNRSTFAGSTCFPDHPNVPTQWGGTGNPTPFNWLTLTANGTSGTVDTTQLTLTFDAFTTGFTADNISVTGATMGTLTGSSTEAMLTLTISNITVDNGENITVTLTNPSGFWIMPLTRTVAVNRELQAATDAQFSVSDNNHIYNGSPQGVTVDFDGTNATEAGAITEIRYESGTYASTTPPTNAGTYNILVSTAGGSIYSAATNLNVGTLTITPRTLTVTPDSGQSKAYGESDPAFTFEYSNNVSGQTPDFPARFRVRRERIQGITLLALERLR